MLAWQGDNGYGNADHVLHIKYYLPADPVSVIYL